MKPQPLVSIIIPTYNRALLIGETLNSVLAQTYTNWECIVVDDGSTDETPILMTSYCDKDARFQYHQRPIDRPKGANACRNYGFEVSKGEYILFLDSDDLLTLTCLEKRVNTFSNHQVLDFVVSDTALFSGNTFSNQVINNDPLVKTCYEYILFFFKYKIPWTIMSVLWKRDILKSFYFDENLLRLQDVDFHIQILSNNELKMERLYEIDNYYRDSSLEKKEEDIKNDVYDVKLANSLLIFIDKYANRISANTQFKRAFKRFLYIISRDFIFYNPHSTREIVSLFLKKVKQYKLLDNKDIFHFRIMYFYKITNTYNKKGFGVFKFRKYANQYYNKL